MPAETVDAIVLGAGFVGVSAALHLQARGRRVALIDRHPQAAGETSFGNAGIVQTEAVMPYVFPRAPREIARGALNLDPRAYIRYGALPAIAPAIWRYFAASTLAGKNATAKAMAAVSRRARPPSTSSLRRHAGAEALLRRGGWIKAFRSARGEDMANKEAEELKPYGIRPGHARSGRSRGARAASERSGDRRRALCRPVDDARSARRWRRAMRRCLLSAAAGWRRATRARSSRPARHGWSRPPRGRARRPRRRDRARAWSDEIVRSLGLRLPFFVKRGYHMHYEAKGNAGLTRPVLDLERGYLVTPMARGLRLTTGAEFARRDDPPSSAHLDRVEPFARELFPIGAAQGGRAVARPAPLPAGHAPGDRAVPGQAGPMARFRPPSSRPYPRPDQRAPAGGTHERAKRPWSIPPRSGRSGSPEEAPHDPSDPERAFATAGSRRDDEPGPDRRESGAHRRPQGEGGRVFLTVYADRARAEADAVDAARAKGERCRASPVFRCRSRTSSMSKASRPAPDLARSPARPRRRPTPTLWRSCAGRASSSSARPT